MARLRVLHAEAAAFEILEVVQADGFGGGVEVGEFNVAESFAQTPLVGNDFRVDHFPGTLEFFPQILASDIEEEIPHVYCCRGWALLLISSKTSGCRR